MLPESRHSERSRESFEGGCFRGLQQRPISLIKRLIMQATVRAHPVVPIDERG